MDYEYLLHTMDFGHFPIRYYGHLFFALIVGELVALVFIAYPLSKFWWKKCNKWEKHWNKPSFLTLIAFLVGIIAILIGVFFFTFIIVNIFSMAFYSLYRYLRWGGDL